MVDPDDFVEWLITQPNANGKLYLKRVARHYVSFLKNTPPRLNVTLSLDERNIFDCGTIDEFECLRAVLTAAPNYKALNGKGHNSFSAGLKCYGRYLISKEINNTEQVKERINITEVTANNLSELLAFSKKLESLIAVTSSRKERCDYEQMKWTCDKRISEIYEQGTIQLQKKEALSGMANTEIDFTQNNTPKRVCFSTPQLYANTHPIECIIDSTIITSKKWSTMYGLVCEHLLANRPKPLTLLKLRTKDGGTRPFLMDTSLDGLTCAKLSNGKYINTNYSTPKTIELIGTVLKVCNIDLDFTILTYMDNKTAKSIGKPVQSINAYCSHTPIVKLTSEEKLAIEMVLESRYTNGFRLDSIELGRLRRFALEYGDIELKLTDDELTAAVKMCGTLFEGKIYSIAKITKRIIKQLAEDYFTDGVKAIFYEEFYAKHELWLFDESVVSMEMLAELLHQLFPGLEFTETYFGYTTISITTVIVNEIIRVWGDDVLLNYGQIAERLRYVPLDRIKLVLGQNAEFLWNSVEVFTHKSRIDSSEAERVVVRETAQRECSIHRYISVTDLPLCEFAERNYELSQTAIHNAAFSVYLSDSYDKRGKIITRKGEKLDALTIMREYCRSCDRVTLDELLEFEKDLTGDTNLF